MIFMIQILLLGVRLRVKVKARFRKYMLMFGDFFTRNFKINAV